MATTRSIKVADYGALLPLLCQFTQVDYTAAGTSDPAVGDYVTWSATGNWYVKIAPDNTVGKMGRVTKLEKTGASSAVGQCVVEWFDLLAVVSLETDDLSTVTLGNSVIKDGNTTVLANVDAGAATGNMIAVAKSGTSGAGQVAAAVHAL